MGSRHPTVDSYAAYISLTLVILTVLLTITLIYKIKYGDVIITRLTLRPYYFALAYLTALLSYTVVTALLFQYKVNNDTVDNDNY